MSKDRRIQTSLAADAAVTGLPAARTLDALSASGIAPYEWRIAEDIIEWAPNAAAVLGIDDISIASRGRHYAALVDANTGVSRYDAVMSSDGADRGDGVPFRTVYPLRQGGLQDAAAQVWIEDMGRWFAGADGRPARVVGTICDISERKHREDRLIYLAAYDELTGHVNRARLCEALTGAIDHCERTDVAGAFLMAGIDNLAMINEAYGFDVADQVIVAVGHRIKSQLRQTDTLGRVAGNKFGVVLGRCGEAEMALTAERLMRAVRGTVIETAAGPVSTSISLGCVALPTCARAATEALARAEEALDQAKNTRRGTYVVYQLSEQRESRRRRNISVADQIVSALNENRLKLAFQPIINTKTGEADLHECLLRLQRPDGEIVSAGQFIPVAEQLGLVRLIDHRVLELAVETLSNHPDAHVALNVSAMTAADRSWIESMTGYLRDHIDIAPRMTVEITETVALHELEESARFVTSLRDLGCRVAIDDFGAGYTSFRNLKALEVDMVKIDGSFVQGIVRSRDNQLFVQTLVHLAKNFRLPTVAEWVTNEDEVTLLRAYGVDYMQGFYLGEPSLEVPWPAKQVSAETA